MEGLFFLKGLIIGFSIAAPVGPIGALCIRRTLANGLWSGVVSGLGAALADAAYGCVAALGVTAVAVMLLDHQAVLRLGGGAFLIYLGISALQSRTEQLATEPGVQGLIQDFISTALLTLANPLTIMSFAAIFAGLGGGGAGGDYVAALAMSFGVFCGSLLWWFILCITVNLLRTRLSQTHMVIVNRVSGGIIIAFGIASLLSI